MGTAPPPTAFAAGIGKRSRYKSDTGWRERRATRSAGIQSIFTAEMLTGQPANGDRQQAGYHEHHDGPGKRPEMTGILGARLVCPDLPVVTQD
jgi:hypothetical protein